MRLRPRRARLAGLRPRRRDAAARQGGAPRPRRRPVEGARAARLGADASTSRGSSRCSSTRISSASGRRPAAAATAKRCRPADAAPAPRTASFLLAAGAIVAALTVAIALGRGAEPGLSRRDGPDHAAVGGAPRRRGGRARVGRADAPVRRGTRPCDRGRAACGGAGRRRRRGDGGPGRPRRLDRRCRSSSGTSSSTRAWRRASGSTAQLRFRGAVHLGHSVLHPLVLGPFFAAADAVGALLAIKVAQALLMALAAIPAYLLTRRVSSHGWSLAVAALTALAPWTGYATLMTTEALFYPAFVTLAWATAGMLERPTWRRQAATLALAAAAALIKPQAFVLLPAIATAIVAVRRDLEPSSAAAPLRPRARRARRDDRGGRRRSCSARGTPPAARTARCSTRLPRFATCSSGRSGMSPSSRSRSGSSR